MKKIGRYVILGLLGRGGMSRVYQVRHDETAKIFALKLLSPNLHLETLLGRQAIETRFVAEAQIMQRLNHANIVKCHDFGRHQGQPYLVMDYHCQNLGEAIGETYRYEDPSRPLTVERVIRYTRHTLAGLACLHEHGVIHCDIKPYNLLLARDETVKIADFGLSRLRGEVFPGRPQLIVGSPYYAAPEQEKDPNGADARSDLYSVGVLFHRMLTGWLPRDDQTRMILPSSRNPDLGANWDAFVDKATATDKKERHQTAGDMLQELDRLNREWEDGIREYCSVNSPPIFANHSAKMLGKRLRRAALKIPYGRARQELQLDEFWRPTKFVKNDFQENGDGTIFDQATQLTWQQSGSPEPLSWRAAHRYIQDLNRKGFAGITHWRLPTIEELKSILSPPPQKDDYCLEPFFERSQKWLWSCDRCSFTAAWYVSVEQGYVARQDFTCQLFVRATSSPEDNRPTSGKGL